MRQTLSDGLPMGEWQRRRTLGLGGPGRTPGFANVQLSDDQPMDAWQATRDEQVRGGDQMSGVTGAGALLGGGGSDPLVSQGSAAAVPAATADYKRVRALERGAGLVSELISKGEGTAGAEGYDTVYRGRGGTRYPTGWTSPTTMTLNEWAGVQPKLQELNGSGAMGKYQFMPDTLMEVRKSMGLSGGEVATPALQDRMMREVLNMAKYDDFLAGRIDETAIQKRLAGRWDSWAADDSDMTYPRAQGARRAAPVKTAEIQATPRAAKAESDRYVQQMLDEGRLPPEPGGWRERKPVEARPRTR